MQQTMTREDVQELLDNGVIGSHKDNRKSVALKFATVKQLSPLRIKLDGDSASLPYSPIFAGVINIDLNDRVVCLMVGTTVIILGSVNKGKEEIPEQYRVGDIYVSTLATSPASKFGGTWVQISNRFLYASSGDSLQTGGASTVTLTNETVPSHRHRVRCNYAYAGWNGTSPSLYNTYWAAGNFQGSGRIGNFIDVTDDNNTIVENTGGGGAHENMPPYITVYMWRRTA